jgi:hypothetical protein
MFCVSLNLTSDEWMRIQQAAVRQWPGELLSRPEICRRYLLIGMETLKNLSDADRTRLAQELQASMAAEDQRLRS